jgi:hypothetical protein
VHRSLNKNVAYEIKSEFEKAGAMGGGRPFHHTSARFSYYASPEKSGKLPSPFQYKLGGTFGSSAKKPNS